MVTFLGGTLALLLIGMSALYIAAFFLFVKQVALRSSMLLYALSIATAVAISGVIGISAVVMGQWG
ncbi:hypothetical protein [Massilia niabensis]|uniref:Uncharacterized protein n=1 Tax=Massilia niabensis TaxID=544910 RepID=A0ABW0L1P3_9BURK